MLTTLSDDLQHYLAERYPGATVSDFQLIASGWESDIYAFTLHSATGAPQALILRPYLGAGATQKSIREARGLRQLHQAGYPVPAVLSSETDAAILGRPFIIMEKLKGGPLWPTLYEVTPAQADHLLGRFGSLLAQLHQLAWQPFTEQADRSACFPPAPHPRRGAGEPADRSARFQRADLYESHPAAILDELLASSRQLYTQHRVEGFLPIVDWLENHKTGIAVQPAVVHLDFHANNVFLCHDDRLAVIDWTQVAVSDYRVDLTWTLMIMGDLGQPQWGEAILHAYCLARGPVEDLDYFNVITYTKLLASTVISLQDGPEKLGMRPETVDSVPQQIPVFEKLARRIQAITGLTVPELERVLSQFN